MGPVERAPARNGELPVLSTGEEIRHSEPKTRLYTNQNLEGEGVLPLTTQRLVWLSSSVSGNANGGYAIDYPFIAMHAVSRDKGVCPDPCLYCQLRTEEAEEDSEAEEPEIPELRFVPADAAHLQRIFVVFSEMSALNPDPNDQQAESSSDGEDEDDIVVQNAPLTTGLWTADENDAAMEDAEED